MGRNKKKNWQQMFEIHEETGDEQHDGEDLLHRASLEHNDGSRPCIMLGQEDEPGNDLLHRE